MNKDKLNLLLVEDSPSDLILIRDYLEISNLDFNLFEEEYISNSLAFIKNNNVDLILLD